MFFLLYIYHKIIIIIIIIQVLISLHNFCTSESNYL